MHCPNCGSFNSDSSHTCSKCGAPLANAPVPHDDARDASKRKTVQMPSYQNAAAQRKAREEERKRTSTNSKPWEARIPTRQERAASAKRATQKTDELNTAAGAAAAAGATAATGSAGTTDRIPIQPEQIRVKRENIPAPKRNDVMEIDDTDDDIPRQTEYKHPIQEPVRDPAAQDSVRYMSPEQQELLRETSFQEKEEQETSKQEQLFIDKTQDTIKNAAAATMAASTIQRQAPTRRRMVKVKKSKPRKKSSNKGIIGALVVILLAACIGGGWFFFTNSTKSKIVSFDTNGGTSMSERSVKENDQLQIPTPPTREGYTFEGWYLDAAYTEPAEFPLTITKDITLYAKWSPSSGTNGSSSTSSSSTSSSSSSSSSASTPTESSNGSSGNSYNGSNYSESDSSDSNYSGGGSSSDYDYDDYSDDDSGEGEEGGGGRDYDSTADVYVIASDGTPLSGTVRLTDGFVLPDSSEHAYSMSELRALGLSDAELCIAWNEPFARLGYDFDNSGLQSYFDSCDWYSNSSDKPSLAPGSAAEITVRNLQRIARESSSSAAWLYLSTD